MPRMESACTAGSSHVWNEIHEQPQAVERFLENERAAVEETARVVRTLGIRHIVLAGRGSSYNGAVYGKYVLSTIGGALVTIAAPSLFTLYGSSPKLDSSLVIGISQSGRSIDVIQVIAEGKRQGALTLAITNDPDSPLASEADHLVYLRAGPERSVPATKTYTTQLTALALLAVSLVENPLLLSELEMVPSLLEETLDLENEVKQAAEEYQDCGVRAVMGRGYTYTSALEIALKLKELARLPAEPFSSADFLHGPIAMVQEGFTIIMVAPHGPTLLHSLHAMDILAERGAELIVISGDDRALRKGRIAFRLPPGVAEWLTPMLAVIPGQLLAVHLAVARSHDLDQPLGLHKVTRTW